MRTETLEQTPQPAWPEGLKINPIPALRDNYVWCLSRQGLAWVVDPGEAEPVIRFLQAQGLQLAGILITHHHADHVGGTAELLAACDPAGELPVFAPAVENIPGCRQPLSGGECLAVLGMPLEVVNVAAHTRGHLAYYLPAVQALFCGDTVFGAGCGRLFEGNQADLYKALGWIRSLPGATQLYCAHEYTQANLGFALAVEPENPAIQARIEKTARLRADNQPSVPLSLAEEKATNPFLRWDVAAVQVAARAREAAPDEVAVLGALRRWKDVF